MVVEGSGIRPRYDFEKCLVNNEITYCDWRPKDVGWHYENRRLEAEWSESDDGYLGALLADGLVF